jgi:hypothetical protein
MIRLGFLSCFIIYLGCTGTTKKNHTTNANLRAGIHETRLGKSNYIIQLPGTFGLIESRGKEGQLGYDIIPKDTTSTMWGFIEIRHGHPIGDISIYNSPPTEVISGFLLENEVKWEIHKSETGYFNAATNKKGDLNARAFSKKRNEIDSLISIIGTLRQK